MGTDCSGIDAPIQALKKLRVPFRHEWSCDIDPMVRKSIVANYDPVVVYENIIGRRHSGLPPIDLYVAGFPCQPFSSIGKRRGLEDARGNVFMECVRTIRQTKPRAFILENVRGLVTHNKGETFRIILDILTKQLKKKYEIHYKILNTADYGIPQHRQRIYIVGLLKSSVHYKFNFPDPIPLRRTIIDIIDNGVDDPKLGILTPHKERILQDLVRSGKIDSMDEPWLVNLNVSCASRTGARKHVCPCLLAGEGGNCVYYLTKLRRRLTPRECLRLQGFPDSFKISVPSRFVYKQAGNAMSVNVLYYLIRSILRSTGSDFAE